MQTMSAPYMLRATDRVAFQDSKETFMTEECQYGALPGGGGAQERERPDREGA